jgi:hypothetical protein
MSTLSPFPAQAPIVDPQTGRLTREGLRFVNDLFARVGGTYGQSNNELTVDLHDDAGIEEIKMELFRTQDGFSQAPPPIYPQQDDLNQAPPGAFFVPEQDTDARVQQLEAVVAELQKQIEDLRKGTTL